MMNLEKVAKMQEEISEFILSMNQRGKITEEQQQDIIAKLSSFPIEVLEHVRFYPKEGCDLTFNLVECAIFSGWRKVIIFLLDKKLNIQRSIFDSLIVVGDDSSTPLFQAETEQYVFVADENSSEIKKMKIDEFKGKHHFDIWSRSIYAPSKVVQFLDKPSADKFTIGAAEKINNVDLIAAQVNNLSPPKSEPFYLRPMGKCGLGAHAHEDFLPNRFYGFYVGEIISEVKLDPKALYNRPVYSPLFNLDANYYYQLKKRDSSVFDNSVGYISAQRVRHYTSYLQHLPKPKKLDDYIFLNCSASDVATANLKSINIFLKTILLSGFVTDENCKIAKGELVGISYGDRYWLALGKAPELFDKKTSNIIPRTAYRRKELKILYYDGSNERIFSVPREQLLEILKKKQPITLEFSNNNNETNNNNVKSDSDKMTFSYSYLVRLAGIQNVCLPEIDYPLFPDDSLTNKSSETALINNSQQQKQFEQDPGLALRNATASGDYKMVRKLIEDANSKIENIDCVGAKTQANPKPSKKTALHRAAESENEHMILYLLAHGADPEVEDSNYKTPKMVAKSKVVKIFDEALKPIITLAKTQHVKPRELR